MRYVRLSDTDVAWAPRGGDTCAFPPVTAARLCAAVGANGTLSIIGDSLAVSQLHALARREKPLCAAAGQSAGLLSDAMIDDKYVQQCRSSSTETLTQAAPSAPSSP